MAAHGDPRTRQRDMVIRRALLMMLTAPDLPRERRIRCLTEVAMIEEKYRLDGSAARKLAREREDQCRIHDNGDLTQERIDVKIEVSNKTS